MIVKFKKNAGKSNRLFVVCPFSFTESVLREKYGEDLYFLSCSGAVLSYSDPVYLKAVGEFLISKEIKSINFVHDTSCRFINGAIRKAAKFGLHAESLIEEVYQAHFEEVFKGLPLSDRQYKLAEHLINRQVRDLLNAEYLGGLLLDAGIEVKGLITSRQRVFFEDVQLYRNQRLIHEC
jgi:hypothetical protein